MNALRQLTKLMVIIMALSASNAYSFTSTNLKNNTHRQEQVVQHLDTDFLSFMEKITSHMPITIDFLEAQKIVFINIASSKVTTEYQASNVVFRNNLTVDSISFREIHSSTKKGSIITFNLGDAQLVQKNVENVFGRFKVLGIPRGDSREETFTFIKRYNEFDIRVGYTQGNDRFLKSFTFNSVKIHNNN